MKALVYTGPKTMVVENWDVPQPQAGEVRVQSKFVGICGSDIHGWLGITGRRIAPMVMGHEMSGVVSAIGAGVTSCKVGDRVTVQPILNCGECDYCKEGLINICQNRRFLGTMQTNGAFAQEFTVPEANIRVLPDTISLEVGALIEPFAVGYRAVKHAMPVEGKTVMVCGSGTIGLMILKVLKVFKAGKIVMVDLSDERLALAKAHGADICINPATEPLDQALTRYGIRNTIDIAIEAVGVTPTVQQTVDYVKNCGLIVWVGNAAPMVTLNMQNIVTREVTIRGTYVYTAEDFDECIKLLAETPQDFTGIISRIIPVEEADAMCATLAQGAGATIKVLVDMTL